MTLRSSRIPYLTWVLLLLTYFGSISILSAQPANEPVYGPYDKLPGSYHIRTFIYFGYGSTNWTASLSNAQLQARAEGIFTNLNNAFNKHGIYFVRYNGLCNGEIPYQIEQITTYNPPGNLPKPDALTIFDFGDSGPFDGNAFAVPNKYCRVQGSEGSLPASQSQNLIHEAGHCLGLLHPYTGVSPTPGCHEITGECSPGVFTELCWCCGDAVCDTEPTPPHLFINSGCTACVDDENNPVSLTACKNYMAGVSDNQSILCTDHFTAE